MESGKQWRVERRGEWKEVHEESGKKYPKRVERSTRRMQLSNGELERST